MKMMGSVRGAAEEDKCAVWEEQRRWMFCAKWDRALIRRVIKRNDGATRQDVVRSRQGLSRALGLLEGDLSVFRQDVSESPE